MTPALLTRMSSCPKRVLQVPDDLLVIIRIGDVEPDRLDLLIPWARSPSAAARPLPGLGCR